MEILCASCGEQVETSGDDAPCSICGGATLLDGRYRLEAIIGRGANGMTYRSSRVADGEQVAIKELLVRKLDSMDTQARFEREGSILEQLDHSAIPSFYDQFLAGEGRLLGWYMVSELIEGQTLAKEREHHRYSVGELLDLLEEIGEILRYLHERQPPVVHRDVKPGNIIRRERDGRLVLIDFGAVKDAVADLAGDAPSVAGTFGFMAPEQLAGAAQVASDIYGLGATAIALLTGKAPGDFLDPYHRLQWERELHVPAPVAGLLRELLAPDANQRPTASGLLRRIPEVRRALEAPQPAEGAEAPAPIERPYDYAEVPGEGDETSGRLIASISDHRLGFFIGAFGAGLLGLFDLGGALLGAPPPAIGWLITGVGWAALLLGTIYFSEGSEAHDAEPIAFFAAIAGLVGLLYTLLTSDSDLEIVYLGDALSRLVYSGLLAYLAWLLRHHTRLAWPLLAGALASLPIAAPFLAGAYDRGALEAPLPTALWAFGSVARGVAHLSLLAALVALERARGSRDQGDSAPA